MSTVDRHRWLAANFAATIFVSAFLLFQVQPLVSKYILPWFGGTPAVWTTCMLFFQTLLFLGYAYAHFSAQRLTPRAQAIVHLVLIVLAVIFLRVVPSEVWKPTDSSQPALRILALLAATVGLPYFVLSSTGPLLQAWFARAFANRTPYRLYALSNVGSLLALLSYPFYFERKFDIPHQATIWMAGFVVYAALCGYAAVALWMTFSRDSNRSPAAGSGDTRDEPGTGAHEESSFSRDSQRSAPKWWRKLLWILLPAFASVSLLATTNHICADISVSPMFWVLPLALYLLTFIVAFDHPRWYHPNVVAVFSIIAIYLVAMVYNGRQGKVEFEKSGTAAKAAGKVISLFTASKTVKDADGKVESVKPAPSWHPEFTTNMVLNCLAMLGICMMCHGELVRLRPDPKHLTEFYLMIAAGGALGGLAVSLIAPNVFDRFVEWDWSLLGGYLLAVVLIGRSVGMGAAAVPIELDGKRRTARTVKRIAPGPLIAAVIAAPIAGIGMYDMLDFLKPPEAVLRARNFFGTLLLKVEDKDDPAEQSYLLQNGKITHGLQYMDPEKRRIPTTYYAPASGVGLTIGYYRQKLHDRGVKIGAVGLGTGTLAAYVDKGDSVCFYEINPRVREITTSGKWFTYLKDAEALGGEVQIKMGDARLSMERENLEGNPPRYDVLVLDAFSGDAIPMHLLTLEAMKIYLQHLTTEAQDGIDGSVAVHISNLHVDLEPVVMALANELKLEHLFISNGNDYSVDQYNSDWIILTHNKQLVDALSQFAIPEPEKRTPPETVKPVLWTDAFSNLFEVMK
jgi:hypothetical protein